MNHTLRAPATLPPPDVMRERLQALAVLDAILMPDWEMRYFSFNSKWGGGEMMASMRSGEGDEFFFLFNGAGAAGKILCQGRNLGPAANAAAAQIPPAFASFKQEPAFRIPEATCYLWRHSAESVWSVAPSQSVGLPLLAFVADEGEYYRAWAEGYYERTIDPRPVAAVFQRQPLTVEVVASINPEAEFDAVLSDAEEIEYPH